MGDIDVKEMYGKPTSDYFASEDEYNAFGEMQREAIENGKDFMRHEIRVRRPDGKIFSAEVTASFFRENGTVKYVTALVRDITDRKEAEKKILDYQERLKALASQLTLAEEKERRRIAADLHDNVDQSLAISRLRLAAAIRTTEDTQLREVLEEISETLIEMSRDTRQLIFELSSPSMDEFGLGPAVNEWMEEKCKKLPGLKFSLVDKLTGNELDEEQRTILFRNIREILTNSIKHANAQKIEIRLEKKDNEINVSIQDNGIGFNPEMIQKQQNYQGGFGLFSVEERMADLGGRMQIDTMPYQGCRTILSLPISKSQRIHYG
jgi:signal transduction histidine kinase